MSRLVIDCGEHYDDMFPMDSVVRRIEMNGVMFKRNLAPTVGGKIEYNGETYEVEKVTDNEVFWTCRKKWSRATARAVRNPYRVVNIVAKKTTRQ